MNQNFIDSLKFGGLLIFYETYLIGYTFYHTNFAVVVLIPNLAVTDNNECSFALCYECIILNIRFHY